MSRDLDERVYPIITAVSRNVHRRFRDYLTFDDAQQDAFEWCIGKPKKVGEYLDGGKTGEKKLVVSLKRHCEQQARKAKALSTGGSISDEFFYEISQLSELLPYVFDQENWAEQPDALNTEKVSGSRQPSEGGNWATTMVDVSRAYDLLEVDDRRILRRYYRDEWGFERLGKAEGWSYDQARSEVGRSLLRLLDVLGGASPWS